MLRIVFSILALLSFLGYGQARAESLFQELARELKVRYVFLGWGVDKRSTFFISIQVPTEVDSVEEVCERVPLLKKNFSYAVERIAEYNGIDFCEGRRKHILKGRMLKIPLDAAVEHKKDKRKPLMWRIYYAQLLNKEVCKPDLLFLSN